MMGTWGHATIGQSSAANEQLSINYLQKSLIYVFQRMDRWIDVVTDYNSKEYNCLLISRAGLVADESGDNNRIQLKFCISRLN